MIVDIWYNQNSSFVMILGFSEVLSELLANLIWFINLARVYTLQWYNLRFAFALAFDIRMEYNGL